MKNFFKSLAILMMVLLMAVPMGLADTERLGSPKAATFNASQIVAKTADYTVTTSDAGKMFNVSASGAARTITLPSIADVFASGQAFSIKVVKTDSSTNMITLTPATGNTVGGETGRKIKNQNSYIIIRASSGSNWVVDYESPYVVPDHAAGTVNIGTVSYDASVVFEGTTANDYETTLSVVDPTADSTWTIPDGAAGTTQYFMATSLSTNRADAANAVTGTSNGLVFEGATANDYETTIAPTDPTADRTATLPDATGTFKFTAGVGSYEVYSAPTVSTTFTVADCGKTIGVGTDALTHVLPATAAGCTFTFVNTGAAGNNIITIDPNASDNIWGTFTLAASVVVSEGAAGVTIVNTKATSQKGDSVTLRGDGDGGWFILNSTGIWAEGS